MSDLADFIKARLGARLEAADSIHALGCAEIRIDGPCDCGEPELARADVRGKAGLTGLAIALLETDPGTPGRLMMTQMGEEQLKEIAQIYDQHPGYDESWRP
jgi:hypothetical protein